MDTKDTITTLEQAIARGEAELSRLAKEVVQAKFKLDELKKMEPCPLEEGKPVETLIERERIQEAITDSCGFVSVEPYESQYSELGMDHAVVIRIPYSKQSSLFTARKILGKAD